MEAQRVANYGEGATDLLDTLVELIRKSERRVWIKVPWWDESAGARRLTEAVLAAGTRGVDVVVLCRPEPTNGPAVRRLRAIGATVVGIRYIHEKELLVDDAAVQHSMNFTSKEIERNENSGFVFRSPELVEAVEIGFAQLLANKASAAVGEEAWTSSSKVIPDELQKYLTRFERLNPLQSKAIPAVLSTSGHVMVVAPTSSGKSFIGEAAVLRAMVLEGKPAVWLLPARALAAEVGETVGRWRSLGIRSVELTGETNMSSEAVRNAQLLIATTEKFEALYRRSSLRSFISSVGCLVIDEVHLVGDAARGGTLEALIARLRAVDGAARIVALSATVANAEKLASWFGALLVTSTWRPTTLSVHMVTYDAPPEGARRELVEAAKDRAVARLLSDLRGTEAVPGAAPGTDGETSVLVFCGSKNAARRTVANLAGLPGRGVSDDELVDVAFGRGVGLHFRDAPRAGRALDAFRERHLHTLVATSGLSTGVNTPARAVVIRDLELGMSPLEVSQAQQMFGRAGRAGQEPEGFGFMLVPREKEAEWRVKLAEGYVARSRVRDSLADALLAEVVLGSVASRDSASTWFEGTFAYAETGASTDVLEALDFLISAGLVAEAAGALEATDLGALTSRLMIDADSAGAMLAALANLPSPASADEAEDFVLHSVARSVRSLREWPANRRIYEPLAKRVLAEWSPRVPARAGDDFGTTFSLAAAHLALRSPRGLTTSLPPGATTADLRRVIDEMPRFLAWMAALGYLQSATWAPAVAGDLSRRLTWWRLRPHPDRGAGRLLWMLEGLIEPENRRSRMQDLWARARSAGFVSPDEVNARPRRIDASEEDFRRLVDGRAELRLQPTEGVRVSLGDSLTDARLTILSSADTRQVVSSSRSPGSTIDLPVPPARNGGDLAADLFVYTRRGDFAYASVVTVIPPGAAVAPPDPVVEAQVLAQRLPMSYATDTPMSGLRRLFRQRADHSERVRSSLVPDHRLRPIALALSEHEAEIDFAVSALRRNLERLLVFGFVGEPRGAAEVLRSGHASADELELCTVALLAALHIEGGLAQTEAGVVAMARVGDTWKLTTTPTQPVRRLAPIHPPSLPGYVNVVRERSQHVVAASPAYEWITEFAPTR